MVSGVTKILPCLVNIMDFSGYIYFITLYFDKLPKAKPFSILFSLLVFGAKKKVMNIQEM